jgi:hypothetical protein
MNQARVLQEGPWFSETGPQSPPTRLSPRSQNERNEHMVILPGTATINTMEIQAQHSFGWRERLVEQPSSQKPMLDHNSDGAQLPGSHVASSSPPVQGWEAAEVSGSPQAMKMSAQQSQAPAPKSPGMKYQVAIFEHVNFFLSFSAALSISLFPLSSLCGGTDSGACLCAVSWFPDAQAAFCEIEMNIIYPGISVWVH